MLNDRWLFSLTLPRGPQHIAARNEAFVNGLRGQTNTVLLWHFVRPQPLGTYRGALSIFLATGQGADAVYLQGGAAGQTLLAGDMIGVNGMLLQVLTDCVADGLGRIGVPIANRLRRATVVGQSVVWDRPSVPFRKVSQPGFQYFTGYAEGVPLDFVEAP